jgi:hypothetical protein
MEKLFDTSTSHSAKLQYHSPDRDRNLIKFITVQGLGVTRKLVMSSKSVEEAYLEKIENCDF